MVYQPSELYLASLFQQLRDWCHKQNSIHDINSLSKNEWSFVLLLSHTAICSLKRHTTLLRIAG